MKNLLQMGVSGSFLIVVIMCFRRLAFDKVPKRLFVLLWLGVLIRMILPFSIPVKYHIWNMETFNHRIVEQLNHVVFEQEESTFYTISEIDNKNSNRNLHSQNRLDIKKMEEKEEIEKMLFRKGNIINSVLVTIWIIVMSILGIVILIKHLLCLRKYKMSLPSNQEIVTEWLKTHSCFRKVEIRESDQIEGPITYGLFRPVILLPSELKLEKEELIYILEHEWIHIKYFHIVIKYFMYIVLCMYWFNPLVWIMAFLLNRDIELACDEKVLEKYSHESREKYAWLLIELAEKQTTTWLTGIYFTRRSKMEERIWSIMKIKKYSWKANVLAVIMLLCIGTTFTSLAKEKTDDITENIQGEAENQDSQLENTKEQDKIVLSEERVKDSNTEEPEKTVSSEKRVKDLDTEEQGKMVSSEKSVTNEQIVALAKEHLGIPYSQHGTSDEDLVNGVTSYGFVKAIYNKAGVTFPINKEDIQDKILSLDMQKEIMKNVTIVNKNEIVDGDVVLYGKTKEDNTVVIQHLGIYVGDGQVIHASNMRDGVKSSELDYRRICYIIRVIQ